PGTPRLINAPGHLVTVQRWREVRDVYDRLSMTPGPSPETRGWAVKLGYAPPLAWDEDTIDDPTATPHVPGPAVDDRSADVVDLTAVHRVAHGGDPTPVRLTAIERVAVLRTMAATGASDSDIAERLGVASRTVLRLRQDQQIPSGQPRLRPAAGQDEWAEPRAATRPARAVTDRHGVSDAGSLARSR
ncbi:helix-turn-helix domain-containing protein, partial [Phycicoccus flavus]|uniref:helix-turn-helix domain-containing protein n=1 Tax=Phycicoccus flavus TaxID=2502783 RepID=UPI00197B1E0D